MENIQQLFQQCNVLNYKGLLLRNNRLGNYYTQIESTSAAGVKYINLISVEKLRMRQAKAQLNRKPLFDFAGTMSKIKNFFSFR